MSGYKYIAKPRLRSPKARAYASKLESEVAVNFANARRPGLSDRRGIENVLTDEDSAD